MFCEYCEKPMEEYDVHEDRFDVVTDTHSQTSSKVWVCDTKDCKNKGMEVDEFCLCGNMKLDEQDVCRDCL